MEKFRNDIINQFEACAKREGLRLEVFDTAIAVYFSHRESTDEKLATMRFGNPVIQMELPRKNKMVALVRLLAFADLLGGYSVLVPPGVVD